MTKLPSMTLARKAKDSIEKRDAEFVEKHGSTDPLRLELRRTMLSKNVKNAKEFVLNIQTNKRAMMAQAESDRKGFTDFKGTEQFKRMTDADRNAILERFDMQDRAKAAEILQLDMMVMQFNMQADLLDAMLLNFDAMTVRMIKTQKKSGKKGNYRHTVGLSLWDACAMMERLCRKHLPDEFKEDEQVYDEDDARPDVDDEDILTEEEEAEEERKAKK